MPLCKTCAKTHFVKKIESEFSQKAGFKKIRRCGICGRELVSEKTLCLSCRNEPVLKSTDFCLPLFSYRLWNKELMFLWKMCGQRSLSPFFASLLAFVLKKLDIHYIVPVPPRPGKIKEKGWDQIDELCRFLNFRYGFYLLPLLERNSVIQQKKLDRFRRLEESRGAYSFVGSKKLEPLLKALGGKFPEKLCIIDDVSTTGSTLECCAREIRKNTAVKEIAALTLFCVD